MAALVGLQVLIVGVVRHVGMSYGSSSPGMTSDGDGDGDDIAKPVWWLTISGEREHLRRTRIQIGHRFVPPDDGGGGFVPRR